MMSISIANAPCSWGSLEFAGMASAPIAPAQMLDELRETGYAGTELGDWGYLPTDPTALGAELERRDLALVGAFVPIALTDPSAHAQGEATALKVAQLLSAATTAAPATITRTQPTIVLADLNGTDPTRTQHAGRINPTMGLSLAGWRTFAAGASRVARTVREATGLRTAFHHHCAGYVETPAEIEHLLALTDPAVLGLVLDTGHYLFGAGTTDGQALLDGLARFGERIWHVHFKDCHPDVATQARQAGWDYFTAVRHGVFCELGQGSVPFTDVVAWLRAHAYTGWIVVEQDVLPGMGTPKDSAARNRAYLRTLGL